MDQRIAELYIRTIKQTLYDAERYLERNIGNVEEIISRIQRLEVLISGISSQNLQYQEQLLDSLHGVAIDLENAKLERESDQEPVEDSEEDETDSDERSLPEIHVDKVYTGLYV